MSTVSVIYLCMLAAIVLVFGLWLLRGPVSWRNGRPITTDRGLLQLLIPLIIILIGGTVAVRCFEGPPKTVILRAVGPCEQI